MNQKEAYFDRKRILNFFNYADRGHINCIRVNSGNTFAHELKKFTFCLFLAKKNHNFITEARLMNLKGRVDIVDLTEPGGIIYEVVASESSESIEEKRKKYPLPIETIAVD